MTTPPYVDPSPESLSFSNAPPSGRRDEGVEAGSLAQEINERRARVENAELLQNLRSL